MADQKQPIVGPWEVEPDRSYRGRNFYKLTRRNSAWQWGRETLLTPKACNAKRFYDKAKAAAEAAKRNATAGVVLPGAPGGDTRNKGGA